jgi:hypothetical protein
MESAAQSVVSSAVQLLGAEYRLLHSVGDQVAELRDDLEAINALLIMQLEAEDGAVDGFLEVCMKQLRELAYDSEGCIDLYKLRIRCRPGDGLCAWFKHLVQTLVARRRLAGKVSALRARGIAIGNRQQRFGFNREALRRARPPSPRATGTGAGSGTSSSRTTGFDAAENQERSLKLIATKDPVGVDEQMVRLERWMQNSTKTNGVLAIVGFGGVGKTIIATDLYLKFGAQYDSRAMVTVSQGSDLEAILTNIMNQVMPQKQQGSSPEKKNLAVAVRGMLSQFKCRCCSVCGTAADNPSDEPHSEDQEQQDNTDKPQSDEQEQSHDSDDEDAEKKSLAAFRNKLGRVWRHRLAKSSTSDKARDNDRLSKLKQDLESFLTKNRYATSELSTLFLFLFLFS